MVTNMLCISHTFYVRRLKSSVSYSRNETSVLPAQVSVRLILCKSKYIYTGYTQMNQLNSVDVKFGFNITDNEVCLHGGL